MQSPQKPPQKPDGQTSEEFNFEQELDSVEQSLRTLRSRYVQVQQDQQSQSQLQQQKEQIRRQIQRSPSPELKVELQRIQEKLDELEINLESRLFSWSSLKEPFWQIVRFGGLGVVIGWFLAFAVINSPQPEPQPPRPIPQNSQP
ncbi:hypothetical protein [Leptothermofonsia sp. ETS-13]|uniref:hypothetical protein n=1 Tax=Leptothermofonsia sp. ETS-13 TaxID=3035696 RepID=UPI003B9F8B48